ncbi:hypothetical protein [Lacticaseibacillus paracasei]|nr:hypothetical protein [Lacticaseibacillus paracasei]MBM6414499.1 hypothetical protein [Lacticaseibacillus paracasei]
MAQMVMTKFGYMSKAEALIIGKIAKEEAQKKAQEDKKKLGRCGDM